MAAITISGGDKWKAYLERLAQKAEVRAGVLEGATNTEGQKVAEYAAYNEFGATINVPAKAQTLYFKQNRDGSVGNRFVKKDKSNFAQDVTVPAHTINIPARPFMRQTLKEKKKAWAESLARALKEGVSAEDALNIVGRQMEDDIRAKILSNMAPANAPSTVARKNKEEAGRVGTLVDTGALAQSISYEISK